MQGTTVKTVEEPLSRVLYILIFKRLDYTYILGYDILLIILVPEGTLKQLLPMTAGCLMCSHLLLK